MFRDVQIQPKIVASGSKGEITILFKMEDVFHGCYEQLKEMHVRLESRAATFNAIAKFATNNQLNEQDASILEASLVFDFEAKYDATLFNVAISPNATHFMEIDPQISVYQLQTQSASISYSSRKGAVFQSILSGYDAELNPDDILYALFLSWLLF